MSSATMDLNQVIPTLLEGIPRELVKKSRSRLLPARTRLIPSLSSVLLQQHSKRLEWNFEPFNTLQNPEPYLEIQLKGRQPSQTFSCIHTPDPRLQLQAASGVVANMLMDISPASL